MLYINSLELSMDTNHRLVLEFRLFALNLYTLNILFNNSSFLYFYVIYIRSVSNTTPFVSYICLKYTFCETLTLRFKVGWKSAQSIFYTNEVIFTIVLNLDFIFVLNRAVINSKWVVKEIIIYKHHAITLTITVTIKVVM